MRQIVKFALVALVLIAPVLDSSAQGKKKGGDGWRDKMRSEKIAFMTAEIGLTPAEAEKFWPLYNEAEGLREETFGKTMKAFGELEEAVREGKAEKEIEALLQKYLEANGDSAKIDEEYIPKYRKVLSAEKVAKLFIAEEKFRRQQIMRLHKN